MRLESTSHATLQTSLLRPVVMEPLTPGPGSILQKFLYGLPLCGTIYKPSKRKKGFFFLKKKKQQVDGLGNGLTVVYSEKLWFHSVVYNALYVPVD